jgi:PspAA-like protein
VIVRILGEGQYRLDEEAFAVVHEIDDRVQAAADADDDEGFRQALGELLDVVTDAGAPLPADELHPSDAIVPGHGTTLQEARELLSQEGLIPG